MERTSPTASIARLQLAGGRASITALGVSIIAGQDKLPGVPADLLALLGGHLESFVALPAGSGGLAGGTVRRAGGALIGVVDPVRRWRAGLALPSRSYAVLIALAGAIDNHLIRPAHHSYYRTCISNFPDKFSHALPGGLVVAFTLPAGIASPIGHLIVRIAEAGATAGLEVAVRRAD